MSCARRGRAALPSRVAVGGAPVRAARDRLPARRRSSAGRRALVADPAAGRHRGRSSALERRRLAAGRDVGRPRPRGGGVDAVLDWHRAVVWRRFAPARADGPVPRSARDAAAGSSSGSALFLRSCRLWPARRRTGLERREPFDQGARVASRSSSRATRTRASSDAAAGRASCLASGRGTRRGSAAPPGSSRSASDRRCSSSWARCRGVTGQQHRLGARRPGPWRRGGSRSVRPAARPAERPRRRSGRAAQSAAAESWSARASSIASSRSSLAVPSSEWTTSTVSLRAAGGQQPLQQRLGVAQRAAGAAGDDLKRLGLGLDALSRADLAQASPTMASGVIPAKSYRWHRDSTVIGILFASVVAKKNLTCGGGSSSVFKQGVEGPGREHVHFVDVVDLEPGPAGPQRRRSAAARAPARRRCCWPRRSR